jgi:hypothetical protein
MANVLTLMDIDDRLHPKEMLFLVDLSSELGIRDQQMADALLLSRRHPPTLFPHANPQTNQQNLRDMYVAKMIDGKADLAEIAILQDFIRVTGIPTARIPEIKRSARTLVEAAEARLQRRLDLNAP